MGRGCRRSGQEEEEGGGVARKEDAGGGRRRVDRPQRKADEKSGVSSTQRDQFHPPPSPSIPLHPPLRPNHDYPTSSDHTTLIHEELVQLRTHTHP
jgi:hypothetical protein